MKLGRAPHDWRLTSEEAARLQAELAGRILEQPPAREIRLVAGLDAAFPAVGAGGGRPLCLAAAVLWDLRERRTVETRTAAREVLFPYIPGLLSFREAPAVLAALEALEGQPDAVICDGQGRAHPRRFGLACHVGWLADLPAIGCAKSRLVGRYAEPGPQPGSRSPLVDRREVVGAVVRTREGVRPVFVSVGHRVDLETAVRLVLACTAGYRLPEPTRLADRVVGAAARAMERGAPDAAPPGAPPG